MGEKVVINYDLLSYYIRERSNILKVRSAGYPKPWTDDIILQRYRFCNCKREDDTVTRWISNHWRTPHTADPYLWFAMVIARLVNWPETLSELGYPDLKNIDTFLVKFVNTLNERKKEGEKVFSGAYIVSTNGVKQEKAEYLAQRVLHPLLLASEFVRPQHNDSLASFADRLSSFDGLGGFLTGQVIADLKYAKGCPLSEADDWETWAISGPGSRRGLNKLLGRPKDAPWKEDEWWGHLDMLRARLKADGIILHAQDVQNNLCEFDKYLRVKTGEGRPRSSYAGAA